MPKPRVAITGVGLVTPLGLNVADSWQALLAGTSGIRPITAFDASTLSCQVAGDVQDFDPSGVIPPKEVKKCDRFIQMGWVASDEALRMANLVEDNGKVSEDLAPRVATILGSGIGGLSNIESTQATVQERGLGRISPFFIPSILINLFAGQVSMAYGLKGANVSPVSACATGTHAVGQGARLIQQGEADVVLAGGAEACICPLAVGGFAAARALSTQYNATPEQASRPFDTNRDGFVMGEGAGVLVLENWDHAVARGANILAEFVGFGQTADAYHMTMPAQDGNGARRAMEQAVAEAGIEGSDIAYVNAHATSTLAGDVAEAQAIEAVCGSDVKISGTKSMTGHLLGAAGGIEAVFSVLALRDQIAPPTINVDEQDAGVTLDVIPNTARQMAMEYALSNSFGFGGTNATLAFKRVE